METFHVLHLHGQQGSSLELPCSDAFEVTAVTDGATWKDQFLSGDFQIVVIEGQPFEEPAVELIQWLRGLAQNQYTYIVLVDESPDAAVDAYQAGVDDIVAYCDEQLLTRRLTVANRILARESELQRLADTDSLSGLATKRALFDHAEREWSRASRYHVPLSCVMLDIDYFKRINDNFGHIVGDEAIRIVARILTANTRSSDVVGRYGGEEFCVILPETTESEAAYWAERVRVALRANRDVCGHNIALAASFGVAQRLGDTQNPAELIELADQALLVAKGSGRDQIQSYQSLHKGPVLVSEVEGPGELFRNVKARQVMTSVVAGLNENETVGRAVQYLLRCQIHSAPVINNDSQLVGMIAERDLLSIMLWPSWWSRRVKEVMKSNVVCYDEEASVMSIYDFLSRVSLRAVVIASNGKPTGIISQSSLLRWLTNSLAVGALAVPRREIDDFTPDRPELLTHGEFDNYLSMTAHCLATEAASLESQLDENEELIPTVVGGATRIQELTNDLLAFTRHRVDPNGFPEGAFGVS